MKQAVIILSIVAVAAISGVLVVYNNYSHAREDAHEHQLEVQKATREAIEADKQAVAARESERLARAAEEAARMAADKAEQDEAARQARLQELNEQLQKEALAREAAEKQAAEIAAKMQQLRNQMAATQKQQAEIAARRAAVGSDVTDEQKDVIADIQRRKEQLAQLSAQTEVLEKKRELIIQHQVQLEQTIMNEGGEITIPSYRVWSPNYRPHKKKPISVQKN